MFTFSLPNLSSDCAQTQRSENDARLESPLRPSKPEPPGDEPGGLLAIVELSYADIAPFNIPLTSAGFFDTAHCHTTKPAVLIDGLDPFIQKFALGLVALGVLPFDFQHEHRRRSSSG